MNYKIAEILIGSSDPVILETIIRMPEFEIFRCDALTQEEPDILLSYNDTLESLNTIKSEHQSVKLYHIFANDTDISFFKVADGTYLLKTVSLEGTLLMQCCLYDKNVIISGSLPLRQFKFALWMSYGILSLKKGKILVHASAVELDGKGYLFLGESGTGKSTHARLWQENIKGARLLNDDSPIISINSENNILVYGSPWSGKTPCYRNESLPLGAITRLIQANKNEIEPLGRVKSYIALHPSLPPAFNYDMILGNGLAEIESKIISSTKFYSLKCLPNAEAAILSYETIV